MNGAFFIGATGLEAQQRALEVVANNIANINTPAFKRSTVRFSEMVTPVSEASDTSSSAPLEVSASGVAVSQTPRVWTDGDLKQTGQPLDVAIRGSGFLELLGSEGHTLLWRGGSLKVNEDGYLAASDGTPLRSMISVPQGANSLSISAQGSVTTIVDGNSAPKQIGQLDLVMTKDADSLVDAGSGKFEAADPASVYTVRPGEEGGGTFVQGAIESGNVQLSDEMVTLLLLQRAYAASAQVVQAGDQLASIVNGLRR